MSKKLYTILIMVIILAMVTPITVFGGDVEEPAGEVQVTLLHTNDFHGRLETDSSGRGGSAVMAGYINRLKAANPGRPFALLDAGDVYFAAPAISQLLMGESTIDIYNMMGYDLSVFGNHEFDKGQEVLQARVDQSVFPWLGANVALEECPLPESEKDECTGWELPAWAQPYKLITVGDARLGVLGLAGEETPEVTLIGTTEGLVFKDLTETILHYYDEVLTKADAMIVVVHMGTEDSGPYDGLVTVAQNLIDAGKPVDLMIGGHQHQELFEPVMVGDTAIVSAGRYGRFLGQVNATINKEDKKLTLDEVDGYTLHRILAPEVTIQDLVDLVNMYYDEGKITEWAYEVLLRKLAVTQEAWNSYNTAEVIIGLNWITDFVAQESGIELAAPDSLLSGEGGPTIDPEAGAALIDTAQEILDTMPDLTIAERVAHWAEVVEPIVNQPVGATNISLVREYDDESNMGDIVTDSMLWSADLIDDGEVNASVDIAFTNPGGLREDILIPDGAELPYGVTWGMTFDVLPFGNTLYLMDLTGAQIQELLDQAATLYKGILQTSGASWYWYNDCDCDAPTAWGAYGVTVGGEPLVRDQVYRVVTNNFLAGGQDGWTTFAEGTNRWDTYYDMQEGFVEYIGMLEVIDAEDVPMGRITRLDDVVTMLHTNDSHGTWPEMYYYGDPEGFAFLASHIKAERAKNPNVLLLDAGDTFQGNAFAQYFRNATPNPIAGGMNLLGYDVFTIGNHEFNFGPETFATMLGQLDAPILGSLNLDDDGSYGFINDNVQDYVNLDVNGKKVTVFGLTNPRVYRYELPTNIPGLTFYSLEEVGYDVYSEIKDAENPDLFVGLTHMGYSPYGDEVDSDLVLAQNVAGIDVLIGGHSHTLLDPAVMVTSEINPEGTLVAQARRYALFIGKVNVGFIDGEIVLREGYLLSAADAPVDPEMEAYLQPFVDELDAYTSTEIGQTTVPIDAVEAYTEETNGANLQADSAVWELADKEGVTVDLHLSGAMSNRIVAEDATAADPVMLTVDDMYTLMPYENSLLVMEMNGPQIKEVLERSYRNWWYYNYDEDYGGYSHYTTCMLTTNEGNVITYYDAGESTPPDGNNVVSLEIAGVPVDFEDETTVYNVSSVNYLAAGSCNFNNDGETIWPLDQIVADTQLYVRDSVINYVSAQTGPIAPAVEGRLVFGATPPSASQPQATTMDNLVFLPIAVSSAAAR